MIKKSTFMGTVATLLVLGGVSTFGGYYLGNNKSKGDSIKQFVLTQDCPAGQSLKGKYVMVSRPKTESVDSTLLATNSKDIDESVARVDMFQHETVIDSKITKLEEDKDRNLDFAIPTTVEGTVANSLKAGDVVAISLAYKAKSGESTPKDEVVISQLTVSELRTSNGTLITEENAAVPSFYVFKVTQEEYELLHSASNKGTLFAVKYTDLSAKPLEATYSIQ